MPGNTLVYSTSAGADGTAQAPLTVESLYRAHAAQVSRWAQRLGGPGIDAEDVVQQVFLTVQKRLHSLREAHRVRAWIFQITHNEVRQARRRERLRSWFSGAPFELADAVESPSTPQSELESRQAARQVYAVLDRMGEKYRSVLILFQLEGLSGEEIAELTGLKPGTVWVRLHRARARFLVLMDELYPGGSP